MNNREIKFRAWNDGEMLSVPINSNYGLSRFFGFLREDAILMQFTGFKDKNGKEIYDRDILQDSIKDEDTGQIIKSKETVYFDELLGGWMLDQSFEQDRNYGTSLFQNLLDFDYEIIGNVFENPELLNPTS